MRYSELFESRGVTARDPGEEYVSDTDPSDVLTIQGIKVLPSEGDSFEDMDAMLQAVEAEIPQDSTRVDDNKVLEALKHTQADGVILTNTTLDRTGLVSSHRDEGISSHFCF